MAIPFPTIDTVPRQSVAQVMQQLAQAAQAQQQAAFGPRLLQQKLQAGQQALASAPLRQQILQQQLAASQAGEQRAEQAAPILRALNAAKAQAQLAAARRPGPARALTDVQKSQEALVNLQQAAKKFGPNDPRTLAAAALFRKSTGFTGQVQPPVQSPQAEVTQPPTIAIHPNQHESNPPAVNNAISAITHPAIQGDQAAKTEVANRVIPQSDVATPESKAQFQGDLKKQNDMNTDVTTALKATAPAAKLSPFGEAQQTQLSTDWKDVNADSKQALEHELPLMKTLLNDLKATNLVGPGGTIAWTTQAGQKLKADLTKAQLDVIKTVHLGRMTQLEFNKIAKSAGSITAYKGTLRNLFKDVIRRDVMVREKANSYFKYIKGGGRQAFEADHTWQQQLPNVMKASEQEAQKIVGIDNLDHKKESWMDRARAQNPNVSDKELNAFYDKKVGAK